MGSHVVRSANLLHVTFDVISMYKHHVSLIFTHSIWLQAFFGEGIASFFFIWVIMGLVKSKK